jgi:hypothetical protein
MSSRIPDFYLASSEGYDLEGPRRCFQIKRLRGDVRDDYLLIHIDPPILGQKYGLGEKDICELIVATRHEGTSLFPIVDWPVYVHVARVLVDSPEEREVLHNIEFEEIAWAELYETEEKAQGRATLVHPDAAAVSRQDGYGN